MDSGPLEQARGVHRDRICRPHLHRAGDAAEPTRGQDARRCTDRARSALLVPGETQIRWSGMGPRAARRKGNLMKRKTARLSVSDLGSIDTVIAAFTDHYGRLMGKRFDAGYFAKHVAKYGTHACNYLLTTDVEMEPVPGYRFANWELGYGDFHMVPDLGTLRRISWQDRTALVHCDVAHVPVAPRNILARQVERATSLGYDPLAASELEYYLFETPYREAAKQDYRDLEPLGWYREDYNLLQGTREEFYTGAVRRHLKESGIEVENSKGEWGLGQHEINIRYGPVMQMADDHTAGFRVVGSGQSLRIECRIPGADVNPYLAFAASLASGLDGIERKTEPPEVFAGDVYAARNLPRVPYTLAAAVDRFEESEFVKESLGAEVAEQYAHFYRSEQRAFESV